ncbi:MAG: UxaA family hydrolase [Pseudomonadota bacterium]
MKTHVLLHPGDSVVTALAELSTGTTLRIDLATGPVDITLREAVPYAHKIAVRAMAPGDPVTKYGEVIGIASMAIAPGDWVHVQNVESARARGDVV